MGICIIAYVITGLFGYLIFGVKVKSDVLLNYYFNDVLVNIVRVVLIIIVLFIVVMVFFCGR